MATHPATLPDLAGYVLGILDPGQARAFEAHLSECPQCRIEVDELHAVPKLLAVGDAEVQVPSDLRARTLARIRADEAPSAEPPLVLPRLGRRPPGAIATRPVRIGPRARRLASAAAVAATVIGLGGGVTALIRTGDWGGGVPASLGPSDGNERATEPGSSGAVTTVALVAPRSGRQRGVATIR